MTSCRFRTKRLREPPKGGISRSGSRIRPKLTPLAAAGLTAIMLLAAIFHVPRGELGAVPMNLALGAIAVFIAWGRWRKAPIASR